MTLSRLTKAPQPIDMGNGSLGYILATVSARFRTPSDPYHSLPTKTAQRRKPLGQNEISGDDVTYEGPTPVRDLSLQRIKTPMLYPAELRARFILQRVTAIDVFRRRLRRHSCQECSSRHRFRRATAAARYPRCYPEPCVFARGTRHPAIPKPNGMDRESRTLTASPPSGSLRRGGKSV
jgi:hypothetical protein